LPHSKLPTLERFPVLAFLLRLLPVLASPGVAAADVVPWATLPGLTNEVVYTLSIDCAGGGLVCTALDAYSDVQVATVAGAGDLEVDIVAGTLQFLQDGTQDVGGGPQPSYATVDAQDLSFAEIPFVGAPVTDEGVVFALTNPVFSTGGPLFVGSYPISAVVDYSAIADIVGPVDAYVPEIVVAPQGVTLNGTLAILGLSPGGGVFYQIQDLTGTLLVSNPTTLLGEEVTVNVVAELTLNLQGNTSSGGGVSELPALGAWGAALLAGAIALTGARLGRARTRS
jgi:hypothetical protein